MILHLITNLEARAGAEGMLCRLVREWPTEDALVVSLMGVSDRNRSLAAADHVAINALGVRSFGGAAGAIPQLVRLLRKHRPSVLMCWMYHAMGLGAFAHKLSGLRTPLVWNVRQSLDDFSALSLSTRTAIRLCRSFSGMPAGIIYNSRRARQLHAEFGYLDTNAAVIPNGFELPSMVEETAKQPTTFGIAGRFHPQKDHQTFFKAASIVAARFSGARFSAVGAGMSMSNAAVSDMIRQSGLPESTLLLQGEAVDMDRFYRSIDVLVLSSRTEGFPNVVAEAMSYGKPVVTTDVGDAAEIVGQSGAVAPAGDAAKLAEAMCEMLRLTPSGYAHLSHMARQRVEMNYKLDKIVDQYASYVSGLGASRRPSVVRG